MNKNFTNPFLIFNELWKYISIKKKKQFYFLTAGMIFSSIVELVGIGSIAPLITVFINPSILMNNEFARSIIQIIGVKNDKNLLFYVTIAFCNIAVLACLIRISLMWATTKFAFEMGSELSVKLFNSVLRQTYKYHVNMNSSEIIDGITGKSNLVIYSIIMPTLSFISALFLMIIAGVCLLSLFPIIGGVIILIFLISYLTLLALMRARLKKNGVNIAFNSSSAIKAIQEGLGGIRDIILNNNHALYFNRYCKADLSMRKSQASNFFLATAPKYFLETVGIVVLALIGYKMSIKDSSEMGSALPLIALVAFAAQKILPLMQQAFSAWTTFSGNQANVEDILKILCQQVPLPLSKINNLGVKFEKEIVIENISFRYQSNRPFILKNINLRIKKGERLGVVGLTGVGKSTLLDILTGLLEPDVGFLKVDGVNISSSNAPDWRLNIAYVPQNIFLSDASLWENITLCDVASEVNMDKLFRALRISQLNSFIDSLDAGIYTKVGERGIKLSGGQRQRIGIARAIYKESSIIILDESTSALDNETEAAVIDGLNLLKNNLTLIVVSHRNNIIKTCNNVIEVNDGMISYK